MDKYLIAQELIGKTLFWTPKDKYNRFDLSLRIEQELLRRLEDFGATHLFYVHPGHSFDGLAVYFRNKENASNYLKDPD